GVRISMWGRISQRYRVVAIRFFFWRLVDLGHGWARRSSGGRRCYRCGPLGWREWTSRANFGDQVGNRLQVGQARDANQGQLGQRAGLRAEPQPGERLVENLQDGQDRFEPQLAARLLDGT